MSDPCFHFFAGQGYQACNLYWAIGLACPWHDEPVDAPEGYFGSMSWNVPVSTLKEGM